MSDADSVPARVRQIFADVFALPVEQITPELAPENLEAWDSMQHLNLVLALEQVFGVQFLPEEIEQMVSLNAAVTMVAGKMKKCEVA